MNIEFYSLGAAEEVTGSKHVLEIDGKSYLIDCGAFQGSRAEADRGDGRGVAGRGRAVVWRDRPVAVARGQVDAQIIFG